MFDYANESEFKDFMNKLTNGLVKTADMGQDVPFEQAFSNIAYTFIQDKAPSLMDYALGFQLVERNDDNSKAFGIFGFKLGDQLLYAPVFFLNGSIKGNELLYLKNQDILVPLDEGWINYLSNKKPTILGKDIDKNLSNLGVIAPNFFQLTRSPAKFASAKIANWLAPAIPDIAYMAITDPLTDDKYANVRSFLDLLKNAKSKDLEKLSSAIKLYPRLGEFLFKAYGEDNLKASFKYALDKEAKDKSIINSGVFVIKSGKITPRRPKFKSIKNIVAPKIKVGSSAAIRIISFKSVMQVPGIGASIDDNEKEKLQAGKVVIKDNRDDKDVSIAYNIETENKLETPHETGLYEVLTKPGEFKKCAVLFGPFDESGRKKYALVIDLESKKWTCHHPSEIWTKLKYERQKFDDWFKDLPEGSMGSDIGDLYDSGCRVLIGPTGQATLPFYINKDVSGDLSTYNVNFIAGCVKSRPGSLPDKPFKDYEPWTPIHNRYGIDRIVITDSKSHEIRAMGRELIIPKTFKVFKLSNGYSSSNDLLDLGSAVDLELNIIKHGELQNLKLSFHRPFYSINNSKELDYERTITSLVKDIGLREKQALDLMSKAEESGSVKCYVKLAAPYDLQNAGPSAPPVPEPAMSADSIMGSNIDTMPAQEYNLPVLGMQAQEQDRSVYDPRPNAYSQPNSIGGGSGTAQPDKDAIQLAMSAAQAGQKEVFDTSMMGSLLSGSDDLDLVDKFLHDVMLGMDRVGRILFMLYWHREDFEERYGKTDTDALESDLRNNFRSLGKLTLKLREKSIEPDLGQ